MFFYIIIVLFQFIYILNNTIDKKNLRKLLEENYAIWKLYINQTNTPETIINSGPYNKQEIENTEIYINNEKISFTYFYTFPQIGEYTIKYKFNSPIINMDRLFYRINSLISLDLSNFNSSLVTNMDSTFRECKSLISIDLSKFDSSQVTYMDGLFMDSESN